MARKQRGLALLKQVYQEMYSAVGDEAEPLQILQAAQLLIDLSDDPHKYSKIDEGTSHSNYYSSETWAKIENQAWEILANERINANSDDRDFERSWQSRLRSQKLREGNSDAN